MGYANIKQRGQGLHLRQFSRSFVIDDGQRRIVFVSVDGAMISHAVKRDVLYSHIFLRFDMKKIFSNFPNVFDLLLEKRW